MHSFNMKHDPIIKFPVFMCLQTMFLYNPVLKLRRILIAALPVAFESCGSLAICFKNAPHASHSLGCSEFFDGGCSLLTNQGTEVCSNLDFGCSV